MRRFRGVSALCVRVPIVVLLETDPPLFVRSPEHEGTPLREKMKRVMYFDDFILVVIRS